MARAKAPVPQAESGTQKAQGKRQAARPMCVGATPLQPKLQVGAVEDPAEHDADAMAEALLRRVERDKRAGRETPEASDVLRAGRAPGKGEPAPPEVEQQVRAMQGRGQPLPAATADAFAPHLGADLGGVRVHTGPEAQALTDAVGARALTVGNDVAFNRGEFQPNTRSGQALIAHELSHVAQQQGSGTARVQRARNREKPKERAVPPGSDIVGDDGILDEASKTVRFKSLRIPTFKLAGHRKAHYDRGPKPFMRNMGYVRKAKAPDDDSEPSDYTKDQRDLWHAKVTPKVLAQLTRTVQTLAGRVQVQPDDNVSLAYPLAKGRVVPKSLDTHAEELAVPTWGRKDDGSPADRTYQVDHIVELQISNWPAVKSANALDNLELLQGSLNGSSGGSIRNQVWGAARRFMTARDGKPPSQDALGAFVRSHHLVFADVEPFGGSEAKREDFWTRDQIESGDHLSDLELRADKVRLLGTDQPSETAWERPVKGEKGALPAGMAPGKVVAESYAATKADIGAPLLGTLKIAATKSDPMYKPHESGEIAVKRLPGAQIAGTPDSQALIDYVKSLEVKAQSPIAFDSVVWDPARGVVAHGKVIANHDGAGPGLYAKGAPVGPEVNIEGDHATANGTIPKEQFDLPGPIVVTSSALSFGGDSEHGMTAEGKVELDAPGFGTGSFEAKIASEAFQAHGDIAIKSPWFNNTNLTFDYDREKGLSGGVDLTLPSNPTLGIERGKASIHVSGDDFSLDGKIRFKSLGFEQELDVAWSEEKGITVGASIPIPAGKLPGLRGGVIDAQLGHDEKGGLTFAAHGRADLGVPGLGGSIDVSWNDGLFRAEGSVATEHENLRGNVMVGVTNEALDKAGQPTGEPSKTLHAYGRGHVEAVFGKNLRGAVDVALTPKAELVLDGEIALQNEIPLFDLPKFPRRPLLGPWGIDFPIFGMPGVHVDATIRGGLFAEFSAGPAVLRNVKATVHFEPSAPDKTLVAGGAEFYLPAHAGLGLEVAAGLEIDATVASGRGEIGVDATLGLDAEARAPVMILWTPNAGLTVGAFLSATVSPKFSFDIFGRASASAWVVGEVWSQRWDLAHFEWGPDIQFGIQWPIQYSEREGLQASFDAVKFIYPNLDIVDTLKALASDVF